MLWRVCRCTIIGESWVEPGSFCPRVGLTENTHIFSGKYHRGIGQLSALYLVTCCPHCVGLTENIHILSGKYATPRSASYFKYSLSCYMLPSTCGTYWKHHILSGKYTTSGSASYFECSLSFCIWLGRSPGRSQHRWKLRALVAWQPIIVTTKVGTCHRKLVVSFCCRTCHWPQPYTKHLGPRITEASIVQTDKCQRNLPLKLVHLMNHLSSLDTESSARVNGGMGRGDGWHFRLG